MPDPKKNLSLLYNEYGKDINDGQLSEEEFIAKFSNPKNRQSFFEAYKEDFENASTQEEFDAFLGYSKATDYFSKQNEQFAEKPKKDVRVGVSSPKEIMIQNPANAASKVYSESQSAGLRRAEEHKRALADKIAAGDPYIKGLTGKTVPISQEDADNLRSDIEEINLVEQDIKKGDLGEDFSDKGFKDKEENIAKDLRENEYATIEDIDTNIEKLNKELSDGFVMVDLPVGKTDRLAPQKSLLNEKEIETRQQLISDLELKRSKMLATSGTPITSKYTSRLEETGSGGQSYEIGKETALKNLTRLQKDAEYLSTKLPPEFIALQNKLQQEGLSEDEKLVYNDFITNNKQVAEYAQSYNGYQKQRGQVLFQYPEEAQKQFAINMAEIAANSKTTGQNVASTFKQGIIGTLDSAKELFTGWSKNTEGETVDKHKKAFLESIGEEEATAKGSALTGPIVEDVIERNGVFLVIDKKTGEVKYIRDADSDRKINEKRLTPEQKKFLEEYRANPSSFKSKKDFSHKRAIDSGIYSTAMMIPILGTSMLSGGSMTPTAISSFVTMFGEGYKQGQNLFADDPNRNLKAYLYAIPVTGIQTAIELGLGGVETNIGKLKSLTGGEAAYKWASQEALKTNGKSFLNVLGKTIYNTGKKVATREGKTAIGETGEELLQQATSTLGDVVIGNQEVDVNEYIGLPLATFYGTMPMSALQTRGERTAFKNGLIASVDLPHIGFLAIDTAVKNGDISVEEGERKKEIISEYAQLRGEYASEGFDKKTLKEIDGLLAEKMLLQEQVSGTSDNFLSKWKKSKIAQIDEQIKAYVTGEDTVEEDYQEEGLQQEEIQATPMGEETGKEANVQTPYNPESIVPEEKIIQVKAPEITVETSTENQVTELEPNNPETSPEKVTKPVTEQVTKLSEPSTEAQALEQERDTKINQISKPDVSLDFLPDDHVGLSVKTGDKITVKAGKRKTQREATLADVQKNIKKVSETLQKLVDCL